MKKKKMCAVSENDKKLIMNIETRNKIIIAEITEVEKYLFIF